MASRKMSPTKSPSGPRSFTRALALAFNEWLLMLMLFANSIFTYVITRFADYSDLQSPCLMCSRLDHILGTRTKKHSNKKTNHWDMICSKHKSEISSLVYCHAHGKLVDVCGMCETCLFSFATTNKSNAETYRLLVGKLGEDSSCFGTKSDSSTSPRYCTCCNQLCMPPDQVVKPVTLPKIRMRGGLSTGKQSTTPKKSVSFNDLPHVGYTELKFHSDTESEALFSEDEGLVKDRKFQSVVDLEIPRVISLPYDHLATDKLLNLDCSFPELNDVPETSEKVLKEEEIISLDNLFLTSRAMEHFGAVSEELIRFDDVSLIQDFPADVSEEKEELIRLDDVSLTPPIFKVIPADALIEDLNDVTSTSEDVLKGIEVMTLHDVSLDGVPESFTTNETSVEMSKENDRNKDDITALESEKSTETLPFEYKDSEKVVKEEQIISLDNVFLTSRAVEPSPAVSKETEDRICLQDVSLTKENLANALTEETGFTCLNDVTSTSSSDEAETPEGYISKGIELMSLHDMSLDAVPESFTTNETSVEIPKQSDTNQADINSLESEYVVVSPTKSMPENSTENRVSKNKEMAPPAESESSSFNSMSVAAETNRDSGELLDLADAYNIIVSNEGNKDSSNGAHIEQWMKKDTSRVSEDLKALLTQISASRGIEFLSPRDISPKICSDQETKDLDHDMQLLIQKRMLERNESNLSLEGVSVIEIEGESESDRLKRQVDHDRRLLSGLYKELEEERSASAVATNQAMAMITRLQEEKALFQMEALQNLRMMEEQAEYDMEAIQKLNDLLVEREKLIQDLEAEIDYFRDQTPQKKVTGVDERMNNKIQSCLTGFNEERLYITSFLEKIENRVVNGEEARVDNLATEESVFELHERVESLKGDLYFLEQVVNSLGHGNEGVEFVKEIASHLQTLRSQSGKRQDHTES